jgi:hypothetical protein
MDFRGTDPSGYSGSDTSGPTPFIDTTYFAFDYGDTDAGERIIDAQFWSSTTYLGTVFGDQTATFGLNLADGRIKGYPSDSSGPITKLNYVYFVRGNSTYGVNNFTDNGDGTVNDNATGLMWSQDDSGVALNWEEALAWVETQNAANYLGYNDWRLPNAKEMQSILDYNRAPDATNSAAIEPVFNITQITNEAGEVDYPSFWTGTTHVKSNGSGFAGVYICFGRAMGYMNDTWMDVHGAGAQRSDPKSGDPAEWPYGHGPQGDAIRIYNYVRCVRDNSVAEGTYVVAQKTSSLCPSGLGFGEVQVNDTLSLDLIMNNTTDEDIVVDPVTGPSAPYATPSDGCSNVTLHPGDTCTITVEFAPSSAGTFYDSFQIPTNDPEAGTITVALSGIGVTGGSFETRGSAVSGPGATVISNRTVSSSTTGAVTPASSAVVEDSTINTDTASVEASGSSSPIVISSLPPSSQREQEQQLLLENIQKPFDSMVFGEVQVGTSGQLRIILSHEEEGSIHVGDIILPSDPYVIVEDKCSGTLLDSGSECAVTVQFTPPSADNFYDYFLIPTDDPGVGTLRINLEGLGVRGVKK